MKNKEIRALIVEDEELERNALAFLLRSSPWNFEILEAQNTPEFERIAMEKHPDLVLLDLNLPGGSGLRSLRSIREKGFVGVTLIITAHDTLNNVTLAIEEEAVSFLKKPVSNEIFYAAVEKCVKRIREKNILETKVSELQETVDMLLHEGAALGLRLKKPSEPGNEIEASHLEKAYSFIEKTPELATLGAVAQFVGVSSTHLSHIFTKEGKKRFVDVVKEAKMTKAWELLISGHAVRNVAEFLGYNNVTYFSSQFKKKYGIGPRQCQRIGKAK
jgi:YesN/AraC family two-component response regulator